MKTPNSPNNQILQASCQLKVSIQLLEEMYTIPTKQTIRRKNKHMY